MFRNLTFQRITASILLVAMSNMLAAPLAMAQARPAALPEALAAMQLGAAGVAKPGAGARLSSNEEYAARVLRELHEHLKAVVPDAALPRDALRLSAQRSPVGQAAAARAMQVKAIRSLVADLRIQVDSMEQSFSEADATALSGELRERQRSAVSLYLARKAEFERLAAKLDAAGAQDEQAALSELGKFMAKHGSGRVHRYTDPAVLPFRTAEAKTREPFTTEEQFQAGVFPARFQPVQLASLGMAGIQLSAAALPALPVAADTAQTEEVRLSQPVRELANELGNNPVRIYNWVRNQVAYLPTYGSIQGSELTLLNKRGNAFDTASLLIALYRAAGIPARYAYGTVEVPIEQVMNWVGAATPQAAQGIVSQGGIPNVALVAGGTIKALRMEHVWVEAYVDFGPSRGAVNRAPNTWVPLDAAFKQYEAALRPDTAAVLGFDQAAFRQAFLDSATIDTGGARFSGGDQAALSARIEELGRNGATWAAKVGMAAAVAQLSGQRSVRLLAPALLAGSLPYRVLLKAQTFQSVPANLRWTLAVRYFASDNELAYDVPMFEQTLSLAAIGNRKLSLSFSPATDADATLIRNAREQGASSLPAYLIKGIPRLSLDAEVVKSGYASQFGAQQVATLTVTGPQHSAAPDRYDVTVGDELVVSIDAAGVTQAMIDERFARVASDTASENLQTAGMVFWLLSDLGDTFAAAAHDVTHARLPSVAVLGAPLQASYFFGIPRTASYVGRYIDAKRVVSAAAGSDAKAAASFMRQSGLQISNFEGLAFDMSYGREPGSGGSAVRLINTALAEGASVYHISAANQALLNGLPYSSDVMADLRNAVAAGKEVIVPGALTGAGNWRGLGYIVVDPETGAGAYLIDGGFNGGTDGAGCDGAPSAAPATQPVQKPLVNLFAMLALVIVVLIAAPYITAAAISAATLGGTLLVASTAATAAPVPGDPLPPAVQQAWERGFGRVYGNFPQGPNYPGDTVLRCPVEQKDMLQREMKEACGKEMKCKGDDCDPAVIQQKIANRNACIGKRLEIMFTCFGGGDEAHWLQVKAQLQGLANCHSCLANAGAGQCTK